MTKVTNFPKLRLVAAIYMIIAALFSSLSLVSRTFNDNFSPPLDGLIGLPRLMAQSVSEITTASQPSSQDSGGISTRQDSREQLQLTRMIGRSGQGKQVLILTAIFSLILIVSAIGIFLKGNWSIRLGQAALVVGVIPVLLAYLFIPRAYFDTGLSDHSTYILSIITSVIVFLMLTLKLKKSREENKVT